MPEFEEKPGNTPQMALGLLPFPSNFDFDKAVRATLAESIGKSGKSREQIADEMGRILGRQISVRTLDDYTAESKRSYRFPASYAPAFSFVTGDDGILRLLLMGSRLEALANFGEAELQRRDAERRARRALSILEGQ